MTQHSITIGITLMPDPLSIAVGDTVIWINTTAAVQHAGSNDGGQIFTTGPIQPNAQSLPISVPSSTGYTVSPAGLQGNISITQGV